MSERYVGAWEQAGLFNPLNAPTPAYYTYNLYSWGSSANGQLGLGTRTYKSSPNQVGLLTNWLQVSASGGSIGAITTVKTDGTLWAWGGPTSYGFLGLNNLTYYSSPVQVGSLTNWSTVSMGGQHTIAVKKDGSLWSWGRGLSYGSLGLGNVNNYSSPKQVGALTNWLKVSAGYGHSMAIKTDGTLWAWGRNDFGQLGTGSQGTNYSSPLQIGALTSWSSIFAGKDNTFAIKIDGTLWAWGHNNNGKLGLSNTTNYASPKQVGGLTNWLNVAAEYLHTVSTKKDGTAWSWGYGVRGQLGLGNITSYSSPMQIGALTNWLQVAAGYYFSGGVKTDGTLWMWGQNASGQLGLGLGNVNISSPQQVGALTTWKSLAIASGNGGLASFGLLY